MLVGLGLLLLCLGAAACGNDSAGPAAQPPPDPGRMHVQISGAVQLTSEWQAYGVFRDLLASDTNELSLMKGQNLDLSTSDSNFTLVFPGRLGLGQFAIGRYVPGVASSQPAAFVILDGPIPGQSDATFFASIPGGTVVVDSAGYPARPGLIPPVLRGTPTFKAVRLIAGAGGAPVETTDTISLHATFAPHWNHYLYPNVSVTLGGASPIVGTSQFSTALSSTTIMAGPSSPGRPLFGPPNRFPPPTPPRRPGAPPGRGRFSPPGLHPP